MLAPIVQATQDAEAGGSLESSRPTEKGQHYENLSHKRKEGKIERVTERGRKKTASNRRPMERPLLYQYGQGSKYEDNEVEKWVKIQSL